MIAKCMIYDLQLRDFQVPMISKEALAHTRALLRAALEDFAACQGLNHAFYVGPDHPFLSCRNSGRLECVLV